MSTMVLTLDMLEAFGRHLRCNEKSPHTVAKYLRDAGTFIRFAAGRPLSKELTVDYKQRLTACGRYAPGSVNSMIASLRGFLRFLKRDDCTVSGVRTQEPPYCPENRSLTVGEYQRLLKAAQGDERLQMTLKVLAGTGIRISELRYFTVEALKKKGRHTSIRVSCKKKSREILVPDYLRGELLSYIKRKRLTKGAVFCTRSGRPVDRSNFWRQMKGLCRKAGVDEGKVFPHNVRKLFARTFYERSHDIAQLACLLGHSSVNTTTIYVKRTEREVRQKMDRMMREILHEGRKALGGRKALDGKKDLGGKKALDERKARGGRKGGRAARG